VDYNLEGSNFEVRDLSFAFCPARLAAGGPDMERLNPRDRQTVLKRIKELNAKIQNPRLSIERVDELHAERASLQARLLEDRAAAGG
jgi:hypothetical protein